MKIKTLNNFILICWLILLGISVYSLSNAFSEYQKVKHSSSKIDMLNENIYDFLILNGELIAFSKDSSSQKWLEEHEKIDENIKTIIKEKNCSDKRLCQKLEKLNKKALLIFNSFIKYYKQSSKKDELTPYVKIQAANLFSICYEMNKISSNIQKNNKKIVDKIEQNIKVTIITVLIAILIFLFITYFFVRKRIVLPITQISEELTNSHGLKQIDAGKHSNNEIDTFLISFNRLISKRILWEEKLNSTQERLRRQKDKLETIFENVKDGIAIVNLDLKFIIFNRAYVELTGYSKEELAQKTCLELTAPEDIEKTKKALETVFEKGYINNLKKTCLTKDNKRVYTNISITLLPDKKSLLLSTKDITALKLLEEQTKLASMGEMIANIAHQWRQPLSAISISATGMKVQKQMDDLEDSDFDRYCDSINQNVQFLSKTIDDFRNFIKKDRIKKEFKIEENIKQFLNLVEGSIKQNDIDVKLEVEKELTISGYENELIQCYMNLFTNAKDAFTQNEINPRLLYISAKSLDKEKIQICFKDNAGGIEENIIDRIFEPYFTTKHKSHGTGLGLHMTYNLITNGMKGEIKAFNVSFKEENSNFSGAQFIITIPKNL